MQRGRSSRKRRSLRFGKKQTEHEDLRPRLTPEAEFETNLALALHIPPSELDGRLTSRDWAMFIAWWEKHGTFESLMINKEE